jgi:hypothetical protein
MISSIINFHKLPNGRLCVDGGKPIPETPPAGYHRDKANPRMFHLDKMPAGSWLSVRQQIAAANAPGLTKLLEDYDRKYFSTGRHCWVPSAQRRILQEAAKQGLRIDFHGKV